MICLEPYEKNGSLLHHILKSLTQFVIQVQQSIVVLDAVHTIAPPFCKLMINCNKSKANGHYWTFVHSVRLRNSNKADIQIFS